MTYEELHAGIQPQVSNSQVNQIGTYGDWKNFLQEQVAFKIDVKWPPVPSMPDI